MILWNACSHKLLDEAVNQCMWFPRGHCYVVHWPFLTALAQSEITIAFLFCVYGHCGKRMCWHQNIIIRLLGCLKCGQPAFFRFPAHIPQAAVVFYFWMDQRLFLWNYAIHFHYTFKCVSYLPADCLHSQQFLHSLSQILSLFSPSVSLIWSSPCEIGGILHGRTPVQPYPLKHSTRASKSTCEWELL